MTTRRGFVAVLAAAGLWLAAPVHADVLSEMENFWRGAAVNTTGPTAFDGQASGHWTLGNLYLRAPVRSEAIASVSLPSFRAGCGGIDAFAGSFSFIDSDQLIAFGRAVAQNAAGFAFELALETISPVIAETMSKLRALAQWVNNQNLDSCETAQALVGAVWSRNDRASAAICAAVGTRQGIFSDYAAARHGCGSDGKRNSTLAAASGPLKDQVPVNVNYAWRAVRASSFLGSDQDLGEFAMSVSGTVIVTAPVSDSDPSGPRVRILEPLALDRRVTEILMEGGGALPVYRCDTAADCLNPTLGGLPVPAARGFRNRVAGLLRRLVDAVRTDTAPSSDALGLVNLTTLPVYRVVNTAAAYRGAVVEQEVDSLAEAVALDVLQVWISDLHRTVEARAGTLDIADGDQLERWREGLRRNRAALARHRHEGLERFNTALAVVEKLRLIETELAGALSADLRAALAFSRGASGSR
ncbi:MAG: conjugal transfer protein TraH [Deltaproteobacteria bacterium]|nr:conjugal transfer protein TraH [Deltaproteobacteria bacterium]